LCSIGMLGERLAGKSKYDKRMTFDTSAYDNTFAILIP
jgi:hypothetical protein